MEHKPKNPVTSILSALDCFPKISTEYLEKTRTGGFSTIFTYGLMLLLIAAEVNRYIFPPQRQYYVVDPEIGHSEAIFELDLAVATECDKLVIVLAEETGHTAFITNDFKMEEESFHYSSHPFNEAWAEEIKEKLDGTSGMVGCHLQGRFPVSRIGGKIMILPVMSALGPIGQMIVEQDPTINFSHRIEHLSFGSKYPGMVNPLNGQQQLAMQTREHFTFFLSIISITYRDDENDIRTNQYTLNGFKGKQSYKDFSNPGLFFQYSFEPLALVVSRESMSFLTFIGHLITIVGCVYATSAILHSLVTWIFYRRGPKNKSYKPAPPSYEDSLDSPKFVKSIQLSDDPSKPLIQ